MCQINLDLLHVVVDDVHQVTHLPLLKEAERQPLQVAHDTQPQPCEGVVSRAVRPPDRRSVKHAAKQGEQQHCRSNHPYRRRSERVAHQSVHRPHHEQQRQCAENEMQYDHRIGEQAAALPFLIERFDFLFIHMYVSF